MHQTSCSPFSCEYVLFCVGMDDGLKKKLFDAIAADKGVEDVMREVAAQNPTRRPAKSAMFPPISAFLPSLCIDAA